jgi:hypothetical protein
VWPGDSSRALGPDPRHTVPELWVRAGGHYPRHQKYYLMQVSSKGQVTIPQEIRNRLHNSLSLRGMQYEGFVFPRRSGCRGEDLQARSP